MLDTTRCHLAAQRTVVYPTWSKCCPEHLILRETVFAIKLAVEARHVPIDYYPTVSPPRIQLGGAVASQSLHVTRGAIQPLDVTTSRAICEVSTNYYVPPPNSWCCHLPRHCFCCTTMVLSTGSHLWRPLLVAGHCTSRPSSHSHGAWSSFCDGRSEKSRHSCYFSNCPLRRSHSGRPFQERRCPSLICFFQPLSFHRFRTC